jgi:hypothetical protein
MSNVLIYAGVGIAILASMGGGAKIEQTTPATSVLAQPSEFAIKAKSAGLTDNQTATIQSVASATGVKPEYITTIGLTENILNPTAVGDNGCSFGAYQNNLCVHKTLTRECVTDFTCSTQNLADWIKMKGCQPSNWIHCLSEWNGYYYPAWYATKIQQNGKKLGL